MNSSMILPILSSSVLTALITAIVSKRIQDKSNKLKYVTEERQKWRKELREAAVELRRIGNADKAKEKKEVEEKEKEREDASDIRFETVAEAKTFFQVRLNPNDDEKEDEELLKLITEKGGRIPAENLDKLSEAIACLLKHDWERVKQETSSTGFTSFYYKLVVVLLISVLFLEQYELIGPILRRTAKSLTINTSYIENLPASFKHVLLFLLLIVPLLLKGLDWMWRHCSKMVSTSDKGLRKVIREALNIPYRKRIKIQENKNGKNN